MKMLTKFTLFGLLVFPASMALAHSGHGNDGFVHLVSGAEQFLLVFLLMFFARQLGRLPVVTKTAARIGGRIKTLFSKSS